MFVFAILLTWAMLASAAPVLAQAAGPGKENRPHLLVITFDTTRADRLETYGYPNIETPSIRRLAAEGVQFSRAYAPAVQTLPSHVSMFTGLYPITTNVVSNGQKLDDQLTTLAEILRRHRYRTGAIVATAPLMDAFNLSQGFETYNDEFEEWPITTAFKNIFRFFTFHKVTVRTTRSAHRVAALGKQWLRRAAGKKKPFFLWIHFIDPHYPYDCHPDFEAPNRVEGDGELNRYGEKEANYLNEIEFADHYLGKILDHLDQLGLTGNTLTVFAADHGESLGEQDYRGHREEVYERIIHVPLIFRFPGRLPAGRRLETPAQLQDVTPTVLRLLGIAYRGDFFQGRDLFSLPETEPRKLFAIAVKLFTKSPIRIAMIYGDYKYLSADDPQRNGLFNVRKDPDDQQNLLAGNPPQSTVNWTAEIRSWWRKYGRLHATDFEMTREQRKKLESLGYVR